MTEGRISGVGAAASAPAPPRSSRIAAVDIARGLAVMGMFAAHTLARGLDSTLVNGRSSILFATLAGVSLGLMTGGQRPLGSERAAAYTGIAVRALLLWLLGSLLWMPRTDIAVILDYYGIAFALLLPALFAPRRVLAVLWLVAAVAGPIIGDALENASIEEPLTAYLVDRLFTGYYPAFTWVAYLAVGLICARSGLKRVRTQLAMVAVGVAGMLAGYGAAALIPGVTAAAHTDTTAEVVGSGGFALTLLGLLLLVTGQAAGTAGRAARLVLSPLGAVGALALTIYTGQLVALAVYIELQPESLDIGYPLPLFLAMAVTAIVFAMAWRRFLGAGPIERLMRLASGWPPSRPPAEGAPVTRDADR